MTGHPRFFHMLSDMLVEGRFCGRGSAACSALFVCEVSAFGPEPADRGLSCYRSQLAPSHWVCLRQGDESHVNLALVCAHVRDVLDGMQGLRFKPHREFLRHAALRNRSSQLFRHARHAADHRGARSVHWEQCGWHTSAQQGSCFRALGVRLQIPPRSHDGPLAWDLGRQRASQCRWDWHARLPLARLLSRRLAVLQVVKRLRLHRRSESFNLCFSCCSPSLGFFQLPLLGCNQSITALVGGSIVGRWPLARKTGSSIFRWSSLGLGDRCDPRSCTWRGRMG